MSSKQAKSKASGSVKSDLKKLGKYDIVRCIGAGGMGTVFLAQDRELKRIVALKVLPKARAENAILVRRFKAEGQAAAVLKHPNIVGIYEAGDADGYFYIALEYVDGTDVHNLLRKRERIPAKRTLQIVRQIAMALEHAHEKRLVHRDIKPANMLITRDGTVKLTDLGLARSLDNTLDTSITRDGTTVGTIDYMSPEQAADSKATDIRSDLYSLGCSWYHMLTGRAPFPEGDLTNKLAAHARSDPPDPRDLAEHVPEAMVAIIHRLMAKRPQDRYQTPTDLLKDLENPSVLITQDSHNLLAVLMEEDDDLDDEDVESGSFIVQKESQATLSARKEKSNSPPTSSTMHASGEFLAEEDSVHLSESMPTPVHDPKKIPKHKLPKQPKSSSKPKSTQKPTKKAPSSEVPNAPESPKNLPPKRSAPTPGSDQVSKKTTGKKLKPEEIRTVEQKPAAKKNTATPKSQEAKTQQTDSEKRKPAPRKEVSQAKRVESRPKQKPLHSTVASTDDEQPKRKAARSQKKSKPPVRIDFDWKKLTLVIVVPLVVIGLLWFAFTQYRRGTDTVENPYGSDSTSSSSPDTSPNNTSVSPGSESESNSTNDGDDPVVNVIESINQNRTDDSDSNRSDWMRPEWKAPQPNRNNTIQVTRGSFDRGQTAPNLNLALSSTKKPDTEIDVSGLVRQSLKPQRVNVNKSLKINGGTGNPVFVVGSTANEKQSNTSDSWLEFSNGFVEIRGVHFIITEPMTLFSLVETDLKLSDCSFTCLGTGSLQLFDVEDSQGRQIFMEDCLVRGQNVNVLDVDHAGAFHAENSIFLSNEGTLWNAQATPGSPTSLTFRRCTILSGDTIFDVELRKKQTSGEALIRIGFDQSWIGGLQPDLATAFRIQKTSDELEPTAQILREHGLVLTFINHHFSPMSQYLENIVANGVTWTIGDHKLLNEFWSSENPPSGLAQFDTNEIADRELDSIDVAELTSNVVADPSIPNVRNGMIGADPGLVAEIDHADVVREKSLMQLASSNRPQSIKGEEVRFDLSGNRSLQQLLDSPKCPDGTTVVCTGSGLVRFPVLNLVDRQLTLRFETEGDNPLQLEPAKSEYEKPLIAVQGGSLTIQQIELNVSRSRGAENSAQFVNVLGDGTLLLRECRVESRNDENIPLLRISPEKESGLSLVDTMIKARGTVVAAHRFAGEVNAENSILISGRDLFHFPSNQSSARLVLDHCTISHSEAFVNLGTDESQETLFAFINNTVFANPIKANAKQQLITSDSPPRTVRSRLNWYELNSAHVSTSQTLMSGSESLAGEIPKDWRNFWGSSRIVNVISGPRAVLFETENVGNESPSPEDFKLLNDCQAYRWSDDGKAIGANLSQVGPSPVLEKDENSAKKPTRDKAPPAGF